MESGKVLISKATDEFLKNISLYDLIQISLKTPEKKDS